MRFLRAFIRDIQSKPSEVKSRYAFAGAAVITGIIALVWMSTLPTRFASLAPEGDDPQAAAVDESGTEDFSNLLDKAKEQANALSNIGNTVKDGAANGPGEEDVPIPGALGTLDAAPIDAGTTTEGAVPAEQSEPRVILIATSTVAQ